MDFIQLIGVNWKSIFKQDFYVESKRRSDSIEFWDPDKVTWDSKESRDEIKSDRIIENEMLLQQAERLKSREMKEGWMKNDEWRMMKDEEWMMKDEVWRFQAVEGFCWQTDRHLWM